SSPATSRRRNREPHDAMHAGGRGEWLRRRPPQRRSVWNSASAAASRRRCGLRLRLTREGPKHGAGAIEDVERDGPGGVRLEVVIDDGTLCRIERLGFVLL